MTKSRWQLQTPIDAVLFDCDGTLSTIEGIDELAKHNGVSEVVKALTSEAMGKTGLNPLLYQQRLDLVYPRREQVLALGQQYFTNRVPDVEQVIQLLKRLNKSVYLVSAGLYPAITIFGDLLQIPRENIFAVDITFDSQGNFLDFDRTSPLVDNNGKRSIVLQLKSKHPNMLFIGDALNDYVVHDLVTRFVGYGGAFYRENLAACCQYYITTSSLAPLIPLSLTQKEYEKLIPSDQAIYHKALTILNQNMSNI